MIGQYWDRERPPTGSIRGRDRDVRIARQNWKKIRSHSTSGKIQVKVWEPTKVSVRTGRQRSAVLKGN